MFVPNLRNVSNGTKTYQQNIKDMWIFSKQNVLMNFYFLDAQWCSFLGGGCDDKLIFIKLTLCQNGQAAHTILLYLKTVR